MVKEMVTIHTAGVHPSKKPTVSNGTRVKARQAAFFTSVLWVRWESHVFFLVGLF